MHWIDLLFSGAGVAIVAALATQLSRRIEKRRVQQSRFARYFAKYQGYHLSTGKDGKVIRSTLSVYQGRDGEPELYLEDVGAFNYTGKLTFLGNTMYMDFRGRHPELLRIVCSEPLTDAFVVLPCVYAAVSATWMPACGKLLFEKVVSPLPAAELEPNEIDKSVYDFLRKPKNPIRIKPMSHPTLDRLAEATEE